VGTELPMNDRTFNAIEITVAYLEDLAVEQPNRRLSDTMNYLQMLLDHADD